MSETQRNWDPLTEEERNKRIKEVIAYFLDERNEEIGIIAAGDILDFFLQNVGPNIYNKAMDDAKKLTQKQLEGLDVEFDVLKKQK